MKEHHEGAGALDSAEAPDTPAAATSPLTGDAGGPALDFPALRESGRNPDGTFGRGNLAALRSGRYVSPAHVALQPFVSEREAALLADYGGPAALSESERWAIREAARLQVLAEAAGDDVIAHGMTTTKGNARASLARYLALNEKANKQIAALGWKRRERDVKDLAAAFEAQGRE